MKQQILFLHIQKLIKHNHHKKKQIKTYKPYHQKQSKHKQLDILPSYTIIQVITMMIKLVDATITSRTVFLTVYLFYIAIITYILVMEVVYE